MTECNDFYNDVVVAFAGTQDNMHRYIQFLVFLKFHGFEHVDERGGSFVQVDERRR